MIYLDYNATTPVDPEVLEAMLPWFSEKFGNPSSRDHPLGSQAAKAVDQSRQTILNCLGAEDFECIFTSGATESLNLAIRGIAGTRDGKTGRGRSGDEKTGRGRSGDEKTGWGRSGDGNTGRARLITVTTEHKAVLATHQALQAEGHDVIYLPVDREGRISLDDLREALQQPADLVSIMWANSETGVIAPVVEIAAICRAAGVPFLCDATQAVGKVPVDFTGTGPDLVVYSGHKIYGPKGIGALLVRKDLMQGRLKAQITGGGHQWSLRSGTLNSPGIVGMAKATQLAVERQPAFAERVGQLRDALEAGLAQKLDIQVVARSADRAPNVTNILFPGVRNRDLVEAINLEVAVSRGASCNSKEEKPSHVLVAMGYAEKDAFSAVRFSLGAGTTMEEIVAVVRVVVKAVEGLSSACHP